MTGKKETFCACPTHREHGAGQGNTGSAFGMSTKLQQSNLADITRLGCRVQASPFMFPSWLLFLDEFLCMGIF